MYLRNTNTVNSRGLVQKPSVPLPNGRCVFWKLPAELREQIFVFAFLKDNDTFKPIDFSALRALRRYRDRELYRQIGDNQQWTPHTHETFDIYQPNWFPTHFVERFLIGSKSWYNDAFTAFYRNVEFEINLENWTTYIDPTFVDQALRSWTAKCTRLYIEFTLLQSSLILAITRACPNLRYLTVTIVHGHNMLHVSPGRLESELCVALWLPEDFETCRETSALLQIRNLRFLEIHARFLRHPRWQRNVSVDHKAMFKANIDTLREILQHCSVRPYAWQPGLLIPHHGPDGPPLREVLESKVPLKDCDIPVDEDGLIQLLIARRSDVFDQIRDAKSRLRGWDWTNPLREYARGDGW